MYLSNKDFEALDGPSLIEEQQKYVALGAEAYRNGQSDEFADLHVSSTRSMAFGESYTSLSEIASRPDWGQITTTIDLIGRLKTDLVIAVFPKGHTKACRYVTGNLDLDEVPFDVQVVNQLRGNGLSLGFIGGTPWPRPEGLDEKINWGASDAHIKEVGFIGFELDPEDPELQDPDRQLALLTEHCPELLGHVAVISWSGNKSLAGFIPLTEPVAPHHSRVLTTKVAHYIKERCPQLNPDFKVINPARIWRFPGDKHQTSGKRSRLVHTARVTVDPAALEALLPDIEVETRHRRESEATDEQIKLAQDLVARWPSDLKYPLQMVLGQKRSLKGIEQGGKGRAPLAWSLSSALQDGMDQLDDLGVPYDDIHDQLVDQFCETCTPPIEPAKSYCVGGPGNPDKGIDFILSDLHYFTITNCGITKGDERLTQKLKDRCNQKAAEKLQTAEVRSLSITAKDIDVYIERLTNAYLEGGDTFSTVEAIRTEMLCQRINVNNIESAVLVRLAKRWGIRFESEKADTGVDHGVFSGGAGRSDSSAGEYLIDGIVLKNEPNIMYGEEGTGKTLHAMQMAHAKIHGEPYLFSRPCEPIADDEVILYIATDLGTAAETAFDRYETTLGYNLDPKWAKHMRIRRADATTQSNSWSINPRDLDWLHKFLTTNKVCMVIIDSLSSVCEDSPLGDAVSPLETSFVPVYKTINSLVSTYSTLLWIHHTRKDGKVAGVPSILRAPSTNHCLYKTEDRKTKKVEFFWQAKKTRNFDERTVEIFMGPDFRFFVAGRDLKFDLENALLAILAASSSPLTVSQIQVKLELGVPALMRSRALNAEQEEVILDEKIRIPNGQTLPLASGQEETERRNNMTELPPEWKFPTPSKPTVAKGLTRLVNTGLVANGKPFKTQTKPSKTFLLTEAGSVKAGPIADTLAQAGFLSKRWRKEVAMSPSELIAAAYDDWGNSCGSSGNQTHH